MGHRMNFSINEFYHVYNRGVEKRVIFEDALDYQRFLLLLLLSNDTVSVNLHQSFRDFSIPELLKKQRKPIVSVCAFTLMPNHFHVLLSELVDGGVTSYMRKVATGYSMYFNMKYDRTGTLFQGRYKAKHVHSDNYLRYMYQYIHLNPIREKFNLSVSGEVDKLISIIENDPYNSLSAYSGKEKGRLTEAILDIDSMYKVFNDYKEHIGNLKQWKEDSDYQLL